MVSEIRQQLTCFQDSNFKFEPQWHRYTYGGKKYTSVTTFLKNFHKPFDEEFWSKKKSGDLGVPQEWLLKEWKEKNEQINRKIEIHFPNKKNSNSFNFPLTDNINNSNENLNNGNLKFN